MKLWLNAYLLLLHSQSSLPLAEPTKLLTTCFSGLHWSMQRHRRVVFLSLGHRRHLSAISCLSLSNHAMKKRAHQCGKQIARARISQGRINLNIWSLGRCLLQGMSPLVAHHMHRQLEPYRWPPIKPHQPHVRSMRAPHAHIQGEKQCARLHPQQPHPPAH